MIAESVTIMGVLWKIVLRKKREDAYLASVGGYCDNTIKTIVIRKYHETSKPHEVADLRELERSVLRHEIVHAFMFESGLSNDSSEAKHWAKNEETVDWIAQQHEKIHAALVESGAIGRAS